MYTFLHICEVFFYFSFIRNAMRVYQVYNYFMETRDAYIAFIL